MAEVEKVAFAAVARGRRGGAREGIDSAGDELRCRVHGGANRDSLLSSLFFASAVLERETRSGGCDFGTNTNSKMNSMKCLVCAEGAKDQGGELFFERKKK